MPPNARGVYAFVLREPLDVHADGPSGGTNIVRFLRDTVALGIRVFWSRPGDLCTLPPQLGHLWPPSASELEAVPPPRFGMYFWRHGPAFVTIHDVRPGRVPCSYVLDEPDLYELFITLQQPTVRDAVPAHLRAALSRLEEEHMLFTTGTFVIALPCRVAKWPSPSYAL